MKRAFYFIAILLVLTWIMSFFVLHAGRSAHIWLLLGIICWLHAILTMPQKKYMLNIKEQNLDAPATDIKKQRA